MATSFGQHVSDFGKKGCPNPECQKEKKALEARIAAARGKQDTLIHQLAHTTAPSEKEKIQRQIDTVDILLADSEAEYSNLPCLISEADCLVEKAELEASMDATRVRIDKLRHELATAISPGDRTKYKRRLVIQENSLADSKAKYNALPCVHSPAVPEKKCQEEEAALEQDITRENGQITFLNDQLRKTTKQSDKIAILKRIAAHHLTILTLASKLDALTCALDDKKCRVHKAELELDIALAELRIAQNQDHEKKATSESDKRKFTLLIAGDRLNIVRDKDKIKALLCARSGGLHPRGDDCQVKSKALEKSIDETRAKIDSLRLSLKHTILQSDIRKIIRQIQNEEDSLKASEAKYNALSCVRTCLAEQATMNKHMDEIRTQIDYLRHLLQHTIKNKEQINLLRRIHDEEDKLNADEGKYGALPCVRRCLAEKATLQKQISEIRARIAGLRRDLETAKDQGHKQILLGQIQNEENAIKAREDKLNALHCVVLCLPLKAAMEKQIAATRVRIAELRARVDNPKVNSDEKKRDLLQINNEERVLKASEAKYYSLPCEVADIDPMCLKDKADLEHEIAGKRKQITQLEGQFHKVAKQSDLIPIQKKIAADKSTIATTEIKYNALPCVIKNQCRVDKAELEAELAMAALRNLELQAQLIKGASESEQRKIYEQTESENRIIHHLTTNLKSVTQSLDHNLPCVPSGEGKGKGLPNNNPAPPSPPGKPSSPGHPSPPGKPSPPGNG